MINTQMEETLADEHYQKAIHILQNSSWLFGPSESEKVSRAIDYYIMAATKYSLIKNYDKAGKTFAEAALLYLDTKHGKYLAAVNYTKSADNYLKVNKHQAKIYLEKSIKLYLDEGKFSTAAKNSEMLAEIYLEDKYFSDAAAAYECAHDYSEIDKSLNLATSCLVKAAYILIGNEDYDRSIINLEKSAAYYAKTTNDFRCRPLYFDISIIKMFLGDIVECKSILAKYQHSDSNEYKMLDAAINAMEIFDPTSFSQAITDYDSCQRLKPWQSKLLLTVKDKISEDDLT